MAWRWNRVKVGGQRGTLIWRFLKHLIFLSLKLCQYCSASAWRHSCSTPRAFTSSTWGVKLLCPTTRSLLSLLSSHTHSSTAPSNQPSMSKNKDLKQSTKRPPVRLAWWLCFGGSFLNVPRRWSESAKWGELKRGTINPPTPPPRGSAHWPCPTPLPFTQSGNDPAWRNGCNNEV